MSYELYLASCKYLGIHTIVFSDPYFLIAAPSSFISSADGSVEVKTGSDLWLPCDVICNKEQQQPIQVTWFKQRWMISRQMLAEESFNTKNSTINQSWLFGNKIKSDNSQSTNAIRNHCSTSNRNSTWLHLRLISSDDHGTYTCVLGNTSSTIVNGTFDKSVAYDRVSYDVTVLHVPEKPEVHVTGSSASSITLQWWSSTETNSPIIAVVVQYALRGQVKRVLATNRSIRIDQLECGARYSFSVSSHNRVGASISSSPIIARTKGSVPTAPPQFQFVTHNSSHVSLYLSQWGNGGCPIKSFIVEFRSSIEKKWNLVNDNVQMSRTFTFGNFSTSEKYELRITSFNSAGNTTAAYFINSNQYQTVTGDLSNQYDRVIEQFSSENYHEDLFGSNRLVKIMSLCLFSTCLVVAGIFTYFCFRQRQRKGRLPDTNIQKTSQPSLELYGDVVKRFHDTGSNINAASGYTERLVSMTDRRPPVYSDFTTDQVHTDLAYASNPVSEFSPSISHQFNNFIPTQNLQSTYQHFPETPLAINQPYADQISYKTLPLQAENYNTGKYRTNQQKQHHKYRHRDINDI